MLLLVLLALVAVEPTRGRLDFEGPFVTELRARVGALASTLIGLVAFVVGFNWLGRLGSNVVVVALDPD